jgi:hypothetical protein
VSSGAVITPQYLAVIDAYGQVVSTNIGNEIRIDGSLKRIYVPPGGTVEPDIIPQERSFYSRFGVFKIDGI